MKNKVILCLIMLIMPFVLLACEQTVASFPNNNLANKNPILGFVYNDLTKQVRIQTLDGEEFTGIYTTADTGVSEGFASSSATGFSSSNFNGKITKDLSAESIKFEGEERGRATAHGTSNSIFIGPTASGVVSAVGNKGSFMKCIYSYSNFTSRGTGVCKKNNGAEYQIHF